jgi:hypothetical protein
MLDELALGGDLIGTPQVVFNVGDQPLVSR